MVYFNHYMVIFMRKFGLRIIVSAFIGVIYVLYLVYSETGVLHGDSALGIFIINGAFAFVLTTFIINFSDHKLNQWIPWKEFASWRFLAGFVLNFLIALLIISMSGYFAAGIISDNWQFNMLLQNHGPVLIKLCIVTLLTSLIYSITYFALFSYNQYAVVHIDAVKNQRKQLKLQFEALKSQLSPHYLFNCLNTISSLIFKDPALAEDFIRRLAQTYQYILDNNERKFVTLQEEVEFVKSYNYLLKVRFENNLHLDINLPKNVLNSKIPPLTLQMLVENAVKHNIISKDKPLWIYISAIDNTDIKVTNTKTETPAHVSSFQIGLDNIRKRYSYFTHKKIKIDDAQNFSVQLPVIKNDLAKSA